MKRFLTRLLFAGLFIGLSYFSSDVKACSCMPRPSVYKEFQESRAVFSGEVVGSRDVEVSEVIGDKKYQSTERIFVFKVAESFKGLKASQVEINAGPILSSCYRGFKVGESYLVYAFGSSAETLHSGACTRTNNLWAAADDLHYIRDLLSGRPEARVYGSVTRIEEKIVGGAAAPRVTPIAGIKVLIEGAGKTIEAMTDKDGLYRVTQIPDGRYKAHPILPREYMAYFPAEEEFILGSENEVAYDIRIQPGVAANINFRIGWNNLLSGRVVDSEGNAIVRNKVSVLRDRDPSPVLITRDQYDHHPEGKFEFGGLTPGRYLLSVDIRAPFVDQKRPTCFYYPNVDSLDQATKIEVTENQTLENREIRLPPNYVVRQIEGILVWPNGVPVSEGWVYLASRKDSDDDDNKYDWGSTDESGRFSLQAFVGAEYWVHGESQSSGKGEPIKVRVEKVNESVKVVIPFPKRNEP